MEENRHYPRVILGVEDGYFGNFKLPNQASMVASIVNVSAGGMNMAVPEKSTSVISQGDVILLRNIAGATNLAFLEDVQAEIRWIEQQDLPGYFSVGCLFIDLSEPLREQIIRFVDSERIARGQYD